MEMRCMITFAALAIALLTGGEQVQGNDTPTMPNIGYGFSGYDVIFGNPDSTVDSLVDPGFRQQIFVVSYASGSVTPDQRFKQPDGSEVQSSQGSCSLSFSSQEVSGADSYQSTLSKTVSLDASGWDAKFSGSSDFKRVQSQTSASSYVFTFSQATCCGYTVELEAYTLPQLHPNFLAGLKQLPQEYNATSQDAYMRFIGTFGTHFVSKVHMGATLGQESSFTNVSWMRMLEKSTNIGMSASASAFDLTASAAYASAEQKAEAKSFQQASSTQNTFTSGVPPPADDSAASWMQSTITDPAPIQLWLTTLDQILNQTRYFTAPTLAGVGTAENLRLALSDYCRVLQTSGAVSSCKASKPDPPFPSIEFPVDQLKSFATVLTSTNPEDDNIEEWNHIHLVTGPISRTVEQGNFIQQVNLLLTTFETIFPSESNKAEWETIRDSCHLLASSMPCEQFYGIVKTFSAIFPEDDNVSEWAIIRQACAKILLAPSNTC